MVWRSLEHCRPCPFWLAFLIAISWLWHPLWGTAQIPAFRDGFHFYYPQYVWLDQCYQASEYFPAWNSTEGLGTSVTGQPTWQLFYPLRILWVIPFLNLPQRLAIWIAVHQIVAAAGFLRLASELRLSRQAGWLAAIAFSLSCPVLFQYSNVVYLCGAAWIGWSLLPIARLLNLRAIPARNMETSERSGAIGAARLRWAVRQFGWLAVVCCLMVLCGDPHTAVNASLIGIAALIVSLFRAFRSSEDSADPVRTGNALSPPLSNSFANSSGESASNSAGASTASSPVDESRLRKICICFPKVASLGFALAVVALTACQVTSSWNWFHHSSRSRNPALVSDSFNPVVRSILNDDAEQSSQRVFDFSVSPWNLPSLVWPTVGGHYQSGHSRWLDALESEGSMWVPSLYMGLLPFLLGLARWRTAIRSTRSTERFLFWLGLLALLLSMGNYSLVWGLREILQLLRLDALAGSLPTDSDGSVYGLLTWMVPYYDSFRYPAKWSVWFVAGWSVIAAIQLEEWKPHRLTNLLPRLPTIGILILSLSIFAGISFAQSFYANLENVVSGFLEKSDDRLLGSAQFSDVKRTILFAMHWPIFILGILGLVRFGLKSHRIRTWILLLTLIDLTVCGKGWITTTAQPECMKPSTIGRSESVCWANVSLANIVDFKAATTDQNQALQIKVQETFLIGKLSALTGKSALHASGSLKPRAIVTLSQWLSRNDNLTLDQPRLDEVLGYLGITQRLVRTPDGDFFWKEIEEARPLCEVVIQEANSASLEMPLSNEISHMSWKWNSNSCLQIDLSVQSPSVLMIRQFNDGVWKVSCSTIPGAKPMEAELFLAIEVPPGEHQIRLLR